MIISTPNSWPNSVAELLSPQLCAQLDRIDVLTRKVFAGKLQGERRSKRRGQSVEFEDYRNYVPGDDLRHIDWNVFARLERFFIKIFLEEEDLAVHLALDASASMLAGKSQSNKLLAATRAAAALGYVGLVNNNRVVATVFGGSKLLQLPALRGRTNVQRLASFLMDSSNPRNLDPAGPGKDADFTAALKTISMSSRGKGVLVLLSDFLIPGGYEEGLRYLSSASHSYDVFCIQVLAPGELDPAVESDDAAGGWGIAGDVRLTDAETGRPAEVTVNAELIRAYKRSVRAYVDDLARFCRSRDMAQVLVRSDMDLEVLLLQELRRRGLLR